MPDAVDLGTLITRYVFDIADLKNNSGTAKSIVNELGRVTRAESDATSKVQIANIRAVATETESNNRRLIALSEERALKAKSQAVEIVANSKVEVSANKIKEASQVRLTEIAATNTAEVKKQTVVIRESIATVQAQAAETRLKTAETVRDTAATNASATADKIKIAEQQRLTAETRVLAEQERVLISQNTLATATQREANAIAIQGVEALRIQNTETKERIALIKQQNLQMILAGKVQSGFNATSAIMLGRGMQKLGSGMMFAGGIGTAIDIGAVEIATKFDKKLSEIAANTIMSDDALKAMRTTVLDIGRRSPAALEDIADGYMHITNFGYKAADATKILDVAQKAAVSSGAKVSDTAQVLAKTMKQFGVNASEANNVINTLFVAAGKSDLLIKDMIKNSGQAFAISNVFGVKFSETTALYSVLARQFSAAQANTQLRGIVSSLSHPSAGTIKNELIPDERRTGVPLTKDFSPSGLAFKGVEGIFRDILTAVKIMADKAKAEGHPLTNSDLITKISKMFPNMRGGIGAMVLGGKGQPDVVDRMKQTSDAMSGVGKDFAGEASQRALGLFSNQVDMLKNKMIELAIALSEKAMPMLVNFIGYVSSLVDKFNKLPEGTQQTIAGLIAIAGPLLLVGGAILKVVGLALELGGIFSAAGGLGGLMTAFGAVLQPEIVIPILAIVAAIALLYNAWKNDWGHIREVTAQFVEYFKKGVSAIIEWASKIYAEAMPYIKSFSKDAISAIEDIWVYVKPVFDSILTFLNTTFAGDWKYIAGMASGVWQDVKGVLKIVFGTIAGFITVFLDIITGKWTKAGEDAIKYTNIIKDGFGNMWSGIKDIFTNATNFANNTMMNWFSAQLGEMKSFVNSFSDQCDILADKLQGIPREAEAAIKKASGILTSSGVNFSGVSGGDFAKSKLGQLGIASVVQGSNNWQIDNTARNNYNNSGANLNTPDKKAEAAAKRAAAAHAKQLKEIQNANDKAKDIQDAINDKIFDATSTQLQIDRNDALKEYQENLDKIKGLISAVDRAAAASSAFDLYNIRLGNVNAEVAKTNKAVQDSIAAFTRGKYDEQRDAIDKEFVGNVKDGVDPEIAGNRRRQQLEAIDQEEANDYRVAQREKIAAFEEAGAKLIELAREFSLKQVEENQKSQSSLLKWLADRDVKITAEQKEEEKLRDENAKSDYDAQKTSFLHYYTYLYQRLQEYQKYSQEWMAIRKQLDELDKKSIADTAKIASKHATAVKGIMATIAHGMQSTFEAAFEDILNGKMKNFFKTILDGFKKLIVQMIAQALAAGIIRVLLGGNFMTGAKSVFGFDDANNDGHAQRWGFDFADMFTKGMGRFSNSHNISSRFASSSHSDNSQVNVHIHNPSIHKDMDINRVAAAVGFHTRQQMRNKV